MKLPFQAFQAWGDYDRDVSMSNGQENLERIEDIVQESMKQSYPDGLNMKRNADPNIRSMVKAGLKPKTAQHLNGMLPLFPTELTRRIPLTSI